ncbi:MAG: hypothetical protein QXL51_00950 [Candidatus Aenigmatarchaeota archaeon]
MQKLVKKIQSQFITLNSSEQLKVYLEDVVSNLTIEIIDYIHSTATQNIVKNKSIDMGNLMNDVSFSYMNNVKSITWNVPYSEYVEYGTPPHWLPPEVIENDIARWAHRKLKVPSEKSVEVARKIAYKIAHEGIEPKPFVRPAIDSAVLFFGKKQL